MHLGTYIVRMVGALCALMSPLSGRLTANPELRPSTVSSSVDVQGLAAELEQVYQRVEEASRQRAGFAFDTIPREFLVAKNMQQALQELFALEDQARAFRGVIDAALKGRQQFWWVPTPTVNTIYANAHKWFDALVLLSRIDKQYYYEDGGLITTSDEASDLASDILHDYRMYQKTGMATDLLRRSFVVFGKNLDSMTFRNMPVMVLEAAFLVYKELVNQLASAE